jgi:AraC-like DNA-binding protein
MLLHDPSRSIKQVADETGFYDRYHFSRVFKVIQGLSPLQYAMGAWLWERGFGSVASPR